MRVGIAANPYKKGAEEIGQKLMEWCRAKDIPYCVFHEPEELTQTREQIDIIVAVGGDGSILRFAEKVARKQIPILGVNLGRVGFLAEVTPDELTASMERILKGEYFLDKRMTLECRVNDRPPFLCLNDVMVSRNSFNGVAEIRIHIDDSYVGNVFCDSVIAATPTGSTGYSLSAGGSVVADGLNAICVTPVCPHTLHIRPIVAAPGADISFSIADTGVVFSDGKKIVDITRDDIVKVTGSGLTCDFIRFTKKDLFTLIRDKLA